MKDLEKIINTSSLDLPESSVRNPRKIFVAKNTKNNLKT